MEYLMDSLWDYQRDLTMDSLLAYPMDLLMVHSLNGSVHQMDQSFENQFLGELSSMGQMIEPKRKHRWDYWLDSVPVFWLDYTEQMLAKEKTALW